VVVRGPTAVVGGVTQPVLREGLLLSGGNTTVRGLEIDNFAQGIAVTSSGNTIVGNAIGTGGANGEGIEVRSGNNTTIGGNTAADRNVISGNLHDGIMVIGGSGARIVGNLIGVAKDGTTPQKNVASGVEIQSSGTNNVVGGTDDGEGNTIAFNGADGVHVNTSATGDAVRANSIFSNTNLGIRSNNLQRAPTLTSATVRVTGFGDPVVFTTWTTVKGTVTGTPNTSVTLEWFDNASCEGSSGEGQTLVAASTVQIGSTGSANFQTTWLLPFHLITVTATSATNNTSSFSNCQAVTSGS
jgi:hypothetical protein